MNEKTCDGCIHIEVPFTMLPCRECVRLKRGKKDKYQSKE